MATQQDDNSSDSGSSINRTMKIIMKMMDDDADDDLSRQRFRPQRRWHQHDGDVIDSGCRDSTMMDVVVVLAVVAVMIAATAALLNTYNVG